MKVARHTIKLKKIIITQTREIAVNKKMSKKKNYTRDETGGCDSDLALQDYCYRIKIEFLGLSF